MRQRVGCSRATACTTNDDRGVAVRSRRSVPSAYGAFFSLAPTKSLMLLRIGEVEQLALQRRAPTDRRAAA